MLRYGPDIGADHCPSAMQFTTGEPIQMPEIAAPDRSHRGCIAIATTSVSSSFRARPACPQGEQTGTDRDLEPIIYRHVLKSPEAFATAAFRRESPTGLPRPVG